MAFGVSCDFLLDSFDLKLFMGESTATPPAESLPTSLLEDHVGHAHTTPIL